MGGPLKGPSKTLKRRLANLEQREPDTPWIDPYPVAMALMEIINNGFKAEREATKAGRPFSRIPLPPESEWSPAMMMVMRNLDRIHDQLMAEANAAKQAKRQAKLERRGKAPSASSRRWHPSMGCHRKSLWSPPQPLQNRRRRRS
jgi:hypothetical protein